MSPSRRRFLRSAGAAALSAFPVRMTLAANDGVTARLARYMVAARDRALPDAVMIACKHRILDTFAAMVSGARMKPGLLAVKYIRSLGGAPQASVIAADFRTTAVNAALANAMCAHADETDDRGGDQGASRRLRRSRRARHGRTARPQRRSVRARRDARV